jgi:hypothetical protein
MTLKLSACAIQQKGIGESLGFTGFFLMALKSVTDVTDVTDHPEASWKSARHPPCSWSA